MPNNEKKEGEGAAAPYAKKGAALPKYSVFMSKCMKAGKDMKTCAAEYKKLKTGAPPAKSRRRRAARVLRKKKKIAGYGGEAA